MKIRFKKFKRNAGTANFTDPDQRMPLFADGGDLSTDPRDTIPVGSTINPASSTRVEQTIPSPIGIGNNRDIPFFHQMQLQPDLFPELTAEQQKLDKVWKDYEQGIENNPEFEGQNPTSARPYMTYKSGKLNSFYGGGDGDIAGEVQGVPLQEMFGNAASEVGLDPTEFAAGMFQEGMNSSSINDDLKEDNEVNSYAYGADVVGNLGKSIEAKLGKDYARDKFNLYDEENERDQAVKSAKFKDMQRMVNTAAAMFQTRADVVGNTAKDLGINLTPYERQYFNYMGYNTQHNAPNAVIRGKENAGEASDRTVRQAMLDFQKRGMLGKSKKEFNEFVRVKDDKGVDDNTTNFYGNHEKGMGQVFYNAGHGYRRISCKCTIRL